MKLDYSILYCCYNRPELVKKSLNILKELKPKKFYIACDGPKKNDLDIKKCKEVRDLIKKILIFYRILNINLMIKI